MIETVREDHIFLAHERGDGSKVGGEA